MRGKALRGFQVHVDAGITPAYAGKSSCNFRFSFCHPGSPPRMRGKGAHVPAAFRRSRDHPRMCREKVIISSIVAVIQGSPPRMRGKAAPSRPVRQSSRITPAYAGKRTALQLYAIASKDHPRMCGEKELAQYVPVQYVGSPPHVRGKVPSICENLERMGITPACAGKSYRSRTVLRPRWDHPRMCREKQN